MKLLVDIGNSRLKWACYDGQHFSRQGACDCAGVDFEINLKSLWKTLPAPEQVVYCTVAGQAPAERLEALVLDLWQAGTRRLTAGQQILGLRCHYDQPSQMGADRWAAMIGAFSRIRGALCVVDCGTAVTVDALAADGRHHGGMIIPGMALMRRALGEHTGGIGQVNEGRYQPASVDTRGAVSTGCVLAVAAFIDRAVRVYQDLLPEAMHIVVTGGDAGTLLPHLESKPEVIPDLVLLGLAEFAELEV